MHQYEIDRWNIRCLYIEMIFAAIMAGIATFNTAFAIRLGASGESIALLNALPALMNAVIGIPAGKFLLQRQHRKWWFLGSLMLSRIGYLIVALTPFIFPVSSGYWIVACLVIFGFPLAFFQAGWNGFLGDVLPTSQRVKVLSRRNVIFAIGLAAGSGIGGLWLTQLPFPVNYSLLYTLGFLLTFISDYFIAKIVVRNTTATTTHESLVRDVHLNPAMRRLLINTFFFNLTWTVPVALFSVYLVNSMNLSDAWIGGINGASGLGIVVGYFLAERLSRRAGSQIVMRSTSLLTCILPLAVLVSGNPTLIALAAFLASSAWSCVDLLSVTTVLELSPAHTRLAYMGWYIAVSNAGAFLGPLLGMGLGQLGYSTAFLIAALVRIATAVLFNINRLDAAESQGIFQDEVVSV